MAYQPKSYKKFVATAATATLVATAVAPTALADFTDVNANYKNAVDYLVDQGIANGLTETTFGVTSPIKRGDAAIMIAKALGLNTTTAPDAGFTDVNARVAGAVNAIVEAGIASGKTSTTFAPDLYITRQETAKMIANAYGLTGSGDTNFTDVNSNWAPFVSALEEAGIAQGLNETTFGATNDVTRGQFALFLYRAEGQPYEVATVESLMFNAEGNEFTLKFAEALPEDADLNYVLENYEVLVNGAAPSQATVDALKLMIKSVSADRMTVVVSHTDLDELASALGGTSVTLSIGGKAATYTFNLQPVVNSATPLNAKEMEVKFNVPVSKASAENVANYTLVGEQVTSAKLSADEKTVILTFASELEVANAQFTVKDVLVKGSTTNEIEEFNKLVTFSDSTAPTLVGSVKAVGTTAEFTFNEPIASAGTVSVNGVVYNNVTVDGNKVTVTGLEAEKTYTVTMVGVTDFANNIATSITNTFTVAKPVVDNVKPTGVVTTSGTMVTVDFSEELQATNSIFATVTINGQTYNLDSADQDANDKTKFTFDALSAVGANSFLNTTATVSNFRDLAGNAGDNFSANVQLVKDTTKPTFAGVSSKILVADDKNVTTDLDRIVLTFSEPVTVSGNLVLKSKNGIILTNGGSTAVSGSTGFDVDGNGKIEGSELNSIAVSYDLDESTAYTFELSATVTDATGNTMTGTPTVSFTSGTFTAAPTNPTKTVEFDTVTRTSNTTLVVDYNTTVTTSALNPANYTLDGRALPAGTTLNYIDNTEKVQITLPAGSVTANGTYQFTARNVVATNGNTLKGDVQVSFVSLIENVAPRATTVTAVNSSSVSVDFSEVVSVSGAITGVTVRVNGNVVANPTLAISNGDLLVTGLNYGLTDSVTIEFNNSNIVDLNGNRVTNATVSK